MLSPAYLSPVFFWEASYDESGRAASEEAEIRALIARWAKAVRDEDRAGIRADHDPDLLMFDVPPPFLSRGLEAYMETWEHSSVLIQAGRFDFHDVAVTAGTDVAFATATGQCGDCSSGKPEILELPLHHGPPQDRRTLAHHPRAPFSAGGLKRVPTPSGEVCL